MCIVGKVFVVCGGCDAIMGCKDEENGKWNLCKECAYYCGEDGDEVDMSCAEFDECDSCRESPLPIPFIPASCEQEGGEIAV